MTPTLDELLSPRHRASPPGYEISQPVQGDLRIGRGAPSPFKRPEPLEVKRVGIGDGRYFEIDERFVDRRAWVTATVVASIAAKELGLPDVSVSWFVRGDDPRGSARTALEFVGPARLLGFCHPGVVPDRVMILDDGRAERAIARTAAHEVRHLWQPRSWVMSREADANQFADWLVEHLAPGAGWSS